MNALQPVTVEFQGRAALELPSLGTVAWQMNTYPVWLRLLASHLYAKQRTLRYQAVTDAEPIADALVLAEDEHGNPLVTLFWSHFSTTGWDLRQWGKPPASSPHLWQWSDEEDPRPLVALFTSAELEALFNVICTVDGTEGHLQEAA